MQILKQRLWIACLIIFMIAVGCATFAKNQYQALAEAQTEYSDKWSTFKRLYDDKAKDSSSHLIVDDVAYGIGLNLAVECYNAWVVWIDSVMLYETLKRQRSAYADNIKESVEQKAYLFSTTEKELYDFIDPYIEKGGAAYEPTNS